MPSIFPDSTFIDEARVHGRLYDFGDYPGLLLESDSLVVGEVYEIDEEILNGLDEIETESHYLRKQVDLSVGGSRVTSWVYVFDPEFYSRRVLIESGDWIEYAKTKTDRLHPQAPQKT